MIVVGKIEIKYVMFASLAKGGWLRLFESTSHPGISGWMKSEKRGSPAVKAFIFNDTEYKTVQAVLDAYEKASKEAAHET